jgi:hypothetical protein
MPCGCAGTPRSFRSADQTAACGFGDGTKPTIQVSWGDVATYESDVFEKRDGQWLLVSHLALRVPK